MHWTSTRSTFRSRSLPGGSRFKASMIQLIEHPDLDFSGCSVTLPHKEHLLRFVQEAGGVVEESARRIGAANTLSVLEDGSLACANTDADAAVRALARGMGGSTAGLRGARVAVFGAGGVARAVTCGLLDVGARVVIFNRTQARADALRDDFKDHGDVTVGGDIEDAAVPSFDAVINCTSVGLAGGDAGRSVDPSRVHCSWRVGLGDGYGVRTTHDAVSPEGRSGTVLESSMGL